MSKHRVNGFHAQGARRSALGRATASELAQVRKDLAVVKEAIGVLIMAAAGGNPNISKELLAELGLAIEEGSRIVLAS